jgi:hypothetical protein
MAYDYRADRLAKPESRKRRVEYVLWLVEHRPDSEVLSSPYARFLPEHISDADYASVKAHWLKAIESTRSARAYWNAAKFFEHHEPRLCESHVRAALKLESSNVHYANDVGWRLARKVLDARQELQRDEAMKELDAVQSAAAFEAAAYIFQGEYNRSLAVCRENPGMRDLALRYVEMANRLGAEPRPLPQLPREAVCGLRSGVVAPAQVNISVRQLEIDAFPNVPEAVANTVKRRGCGIPQPQTQGGVNVIRGEFFEQGQAGWAVLCSTRGSSSILVFRGDRDTEPEEIARGEDRNYIQDAVYSRQISTVGERYITQHYRAYGGPEPPAIVHDAIDDAFLEKASIVYYRHGGKWLRLQGAD